MRGFIERWFAALAERDAETLVEMTTPDVVIRPFLARQGVAAVGYRGHDGIREWVASFDSTLRIDLDLTGIEITSAETAIVEAGVSFESDGARTGGPTFSVWRFRDGKLAEAVGYGTREDALDAERGSWH